MLENAKIVATKRKSKIVAEREKIDFEDIYYNILKQLASVIDSSKNYKEEFRIVWDKRQSPKIKEQNIIRIPKMMIENRIQLFNHVLDQLEYEDYDAVNIEKPSGDICGFIVKWSDFDDIKPFEFKENQDEGFEILDLDKDDDSGLL